MNRIFGLCVLTLFSALSEAAADKPQPAIVQKARTALEERAAGYRNCSFQLVTMRRPEGSQTSRGRETTQTIYRGPNGEVKRAQPRSPRLSTPGPEGFPGMSPRPGFSASFDPLSLDLMLGAPDLLVRVDVGGTTTIAGVSCRRLRVRPKVENLDVDKAFVWVDETTGMPLRVEMTFLLEPFGQGKAILDLHMDPERGFALPTTQTLTMEMEGPIGPGPGLSSETVYEWKEFKWNLTFAADFFAGAARPTGQASGAATGPASAAAAPAREGGAQTTATLSADDPFQEIALAPEPGSENLLATSPAGASSSGADRERILVRGAGMSRESAAIGEGSARFGLPNDGAQGPPGSESGGREGSAAGGGRAGGGVMEGLFGGMGGMGGPGGMGGGPGRMGGFRGGMIGGSRANAIQGSVQVGLSGSYLDAKPYSITGEKLAPRDYGRFSTSVSLGGPMPFVKSTTGQAPTTSQRRSGFRRGRERGASFFLSYSVVRGTQSNSAFASVPTALERAGDFSQTLYQSGPLAGSAVRLFDPVSGAAFENARIPAQRLNATSLALLGYYPSPNREGAYLNYFSEQALGTHQDRVGVNLTFPISSRIRLSAAYNADRGASDNFSVFPNLASRSRTLGQNISLNTNQTLRRGLLNHLRVRWNRNRSNRLNAFANERNISGELGIPNTSPAPIDFGLPTINLTNYTDLQNAASSLVVRETQSVGDSIGLVVARHFLNLGGEYTVIRRNQLGNSEGNGALTFAGIATSEYLPDGSLVPGTGYDLADFLLGLGQSSRIRFGNSDHYVRGYQFALYLNDNYRMSSRFTVQWGLRYQFASPLVEKYDRLANLDFDAGMTRAAVVLPGEQGAFSGPSPRALVRSDRNNFAPRVGVAYRLYSKRRWTSIVRATYGVFYPEEAYGRIVDQLMSQPPFGVAVQRTVEGQDYLTYADAFESGAQGEVQNNYAIDPYFRLQTVQNWSVSLQQTLPRNIVLSVGYAGARGAGLEVLRAPNRYVDGSLRIENAGEFLYLTSGGNSIFHGLQVMAARRMRAGFSVGGQYEFGRAIDDASSIGGSAMTVVQNETDLAAERGLSNFDVRHNASVRWNWELPFGPRRKWLKDASFMSRALSNWFINGTLRASSGRPLTARLQGSQINNSGSGAFASERADATGLPVTLPKDERTVLRYFNTDAFALPADGVFGNAGRNTITAPGLWTVDMSASRVIRFSGERGRLMVSVDAQNALNHVNYSGLNTVVNSRGFGQVTSAGAMRRVQLNFRFMF
jgi:hypothetical protein